MVATSLLWRDPRSSSVTFETALPSFYRLLLMLEADMESRDDVLTLALTDGISQRGKHHHWWMKFCRRPTLG